MTRCVEFYEKLEKDGNFCGMTDEAYNRAMVYWNEYRKEAERKSTKVVLSLTEWFNQKKKAAEVAKHKTERFVGTEKQIEEADEFECPTCASAKENVLDAMSVLDHYGIPPDLGDKVQKWIEEKYGA